MSRTSYTGHIIDSRIASGVHAEDGMKFRYLNHLFAITARGLILQLPEKMHRRTSLAVVHPGADHRRPERRVDGSKNISNNRA